jgi:predicted metal-dependent phosphoesterase TrpH
MSERTCDLHMHSTASDGSDPPAALAELASQAGLSAFALTDHDTTAGLKPCAEAAAHLDIAFVPGIELSADPASVQAPGRAGRETADASADAVAAGTLHILGYFIDPDAPGLARLQQRLREARQQRNPAMVARLNELGVKLTHQQVVELAEHEGSQAPGRPHIARLLMDKGYVKSIHEAFARYIGQGGAAYVRKDRLSAQEAIDAIHQAGGLASLAHPVQLELDDEALEHAIARLSDAGLDAIELYHSDHQPRDRQRFAQFAEQFNLLTTGGSDYHGARKHIALGSQRVPYAIYQQLHEAWQRIVQ